jgi:hypothetical protein
MDFTSNYTHKFNRELVTRNLLILITKIKSLSSIYAQKSNDYSIIFEEWSGLYADFYTNDEGEIISGWTTCLCSHPRVKKVYQAYNHVTDKYAGPIGECCITRFFDNPILLERLKKLNDNLKKKKRDYKKQFKEREKYIQERNIFINNNKDSELTIGKFKGKTFEYMCSTQPGYFVWWKQKPESDYPWIIKQLFRYKQYRNEKRCEEKQNE